MTRKFRLPFISLAATIAGPALAQAVDYAALQATMGEPVTTSVTGKPQRASETPASIVIITRDQIIRSPARDVPGLLKTYAGIEVNRWTAGQSDVAVRGGVQTYNARLLVLVNGRQVYLDHYGMTDWNLLGVQLEDIQQIELVRGPGTALFGFNAASGVVNIITTNALNSRHLTASAGVGNHGYDRLGLSLSLPLAKDVALRLSAGHQRENERAVPSAQLQTPDQTVKRDEIAGSLEIAPDDRTRLALDGGYSQNMQLEYLPTQFPSVQTFKSDNIGLRADRDMDWGSLSAHGYVNRLRSVYRFNGGQLHIKNQIGSAQASALVRLGLQNTLRLGAEYRANRLDSDSAYSHRIDYKVLSGSGMIDLHPNDNLALTFAGRLDRLSLAQDGAAVQPAANLDADFDRNLVRASFNAAMVLQLDSQSQLRINGGRGYQLPSLIDYGVRLPVGIAPPGLPLVVAGDPSIDPVEVWSAEVGYRRAIGESVTFEGTAYYTRTNGVIGSPGSATNFALSLVSGPVLVSRFASAGDFETYGTEISLSGAFTRNLKWRANYTLTETTTKLVPPEVLAFAPKRTTPRHIGNLELGYVQPKWFATTVLRYTSSTWQFGTTALGNVAFFPISGALSWDQKFGYRISKAFTFTLAGENLAKADGSAGSQIPADRRIRAALVLSL